MSYIARFDNIKGQRQNSIALLGKSGAGKTHLLSAIANELIDRGVPILYFPFVEGFNEIKDDFEMLESRINKMQKIDVLFIDDMFKGRKEPTQFQIEQMFAVINYRYINHLPMLISSEKTINDLIQIDEALGSRIYEMCKDYMVELKGDKLNYRMRDTDET
jgi:DNA replication protein DnaC